MLRSLLDKMRERLSSFLARILFKINNKKNKELENSKINKKENKDIKIISYKIRYIKENKKKTN